MSNLCALSNEASLVFFLAYLPTSIASVSSC